MKILHLVPSLNKGGAERMALSIASGLQDEGHEVKLVCLHDVNEYRFLSKSLDCIVVKTNVQLSFMRSNRVDVSELQYVIDTFQPDVIHSHLFESEINLAFCNIPLTCKRIIHFHDNMIQMKKFSINTLFKKSKTANFYERRLVLKKLPTNATMIGISKDSMSFIMKNIPRYYNKKLLLNAIDIKRFSPGVKQKNKAELVTIGSLVSKKGHDLAVQTIFELKKRGVEVHLTIIGDGPLRKELKSLIDHLALNDMISLKGLVDYPEVYLQNASIYIHTASYEAFGLVLVEAMACGLPVVCSDGLGNRDVIDDGENGFLVKSRDAKALADKIQYLIANDNERNLMGAKALEISKKYGMETYISKLLSIYKS